VVITVPATLPTPWIPHRRTTFPVIVDPPGWTTNIQPVLTFGTTDDYSGIDHYELSIDNGTPQIVTQPVYLASLSDGIHDIKVTAFDKAQNPKDFLTNVYIDTTPPDPFEINVIPPGWTNVPPVITFETMDSCGGVDYYTLSIDNGTPQTVTSPYQLPV